MVNYVRNMREDLNESAFTLIELIVVMAILAILVLLAAPQFLGYTSKAEDARIQNDVAVAEMKTSENLINHKWAEKEFSGWANTGAEGQEFNKSFLIGLAESGLYGKGGKLDPTNPVDLDKEIPSGQYRIIPQSILDKDVRTQLDGTFFANENGDVFYTPDLIEGVVDESIGGGTESDTDKENGSGENASENEYGGYVSEEDIAWVDNLINNEGYEMAQLIDFEWQGPDYDTWWGYWKYVGDGGKIIIPKTLDDQIVTKFERMFEYNDNVIAVASNNPNVVQADYMFSMSTAPTLDISELYTGNVTNMNNMFEYASANVLNLGDMDTSSAVLMSEMFMYVTNAELNLSSFDTSNVEEMHGMFSGGLTQELDLSSFDTSNVQIMSYMFGDYLGTSLDLSSFNTSNVTTMSSMFYNANQLTSLNLSSFDTSNVTNMSEMFSSTNELKELDLSNFNTGRVESMDWMFNHTGISELDLSSFDISKVTNMEYMFQSWDIYRVVAATSEISDIFSSSEGTTPNTFFTHK